MSSGGRFKVRRLTLGGSGLRGGRLTRRIERANACARPPRRHLPGRGASGLGVAPLGTGALLGHRRRGGSKVSRRNVGKRCRQRHLARVRPAAERGNNRVEGLRPFNNHLPVRARSGGGNEAQ